jgi:hypothetical protein
MADLSGNSFDLRNSSTPLIMKKARGLEVCTDTSGHLGISKPITMYMLVKHCIVDFQGRVPYGCLIICGRWQPASATIFLPIAGFPASSGRPSLA